MIEFGWLVHDLANWVHLSRTFNIILGDSVCLFSIYPYDISVVRELKADGSSDVLHFTKLLGQNGSEILESAVNSGAWSF